MFWVKVSGTDTGFVDTWAADVPGGALVEVVHYDDVYDAVLSAVVFVPGASVDALGPVVDGSIDAEAEK